MSKLAFHQSPGASSLTGLVVANGTSAATSIKVNLSAVSDPGVGDDSGDGYSVGSVWVNTAGNKVFLCANATLGAAVWSEVASSGGIKETITVANAFSAANAIRRTAGGYSKSQADSASNSEVMGIIESASGTDFTIVYFGKANLPAHGFTVGAVLFLSEATAGLLTETEPTTAGQVSKPVGIALDANNILVINMRGSVIGGPLSILVNSQTGTSYTILSGDRDKLVTTTNGSAIAVTLPQAGASFPSGWFFFYQNRGAGTATITPTTSTIDGAAILVLKTGQGAVIFSDGTNYFTMRGVQSFDTLAPTTTAGDIIFRNSTTNTRLAIGSALQQLRTNALATAPEWFTPIFTKEFISSDQVITAGGLLTLAHSLGVKAKLIQVFLKNNITDLSWDPGDDPVQPFHAQPSAGVNQGAITWSDTTDVFVRIGGSAASFAILDKDSGAFGNIDNSKWSIIVRAWA